MLYSDPKACRQSLLSRVPRKEVPIDPSTMREQVERSPGMSAAEFNQLEDGLDASALLLIKDIPNRKTMHLSKNPQQNQSVTRADGTFNLEAARTMWKVANQNYREGRAMQMQTRKRWKFPFH